MELATLSPAWGADVARRGAVSTSKVPLIAISWIWESQNESASVEQAVEVFSKVFGGLYPGRTALNILWTSHPAK